MARFAREKEREEKENQRKKEAREKERAYQVSTCDVPLFWY